MWRFVGGERGLEPLTGIGPDALTDEAFEQRVAAYEAQFAEGAGSVAASGLYEHDGPAPRRRGAEAPADEEG